MTNWILNIENLYWETRVKQGYRFLSLPQISSSFQWKNLKRKVIKKEGVYYFGKLKSNNKFFIAAKYMDLGTAPDEEDKRPISHTFIWFPNDLKRENLSTIPIDWDKQLFKGLQKIRDEYFNIPLNVKVIENVQSQVAPFPIEETQNQSLDWIDVGTIDMDEIPQNPYRPKHRPIENDKKKRNSFPTRGMVSGGALGVLLGKTLGTTLTGGMGAMIGGVIGAKAEIEIRKMIAKNKGK